MFEKSLVEGKIRQGKIKAFHKSMSKRYIHIYMYARLIMIEYLFWTDLLGVV